MAERRWLRSLTGAAWPLLQLTAAATLAWFIALTLGGHEDPFFAPIAGVVALSSQLGERGANALRLVLGVVVGIVIGELTVGILGGGYGRLALATFISTAIARAFTSTRLVIVQAASAAILTVASSNGQAGVHRLIDALIGAAVALLGSQFVFSPEPVRLVRRAESKALRGIADALALTARALKTDDGDLSAAATEKLRALHDDLAELGRLREASPRVRHSVVWRRRMSPVVHENENAGHLDLLGASCLMLIRTAIATSPRERRVLAPRVDAPAEILKAMAVDPGDPGIRQHAVDRSLGLVHDITPDVVAPKGSALATAHVAVRMVVTDLMIFAGVPAEAALDAGVAGG